MSILGLALRNILRNPIRTFLTAFGVTAAVAGFCFLQSLSDGLTAGMMSTGASNRLTVYGLRSRIPLAFTERIKQQVPEIEAISCFAFYAVRDNEDRAFAVAASSDDGSTVPHYFEPPAAQLEAWKNNRSGLLISTDTAEQLSLRVGDRVTFFTDKASNPELALTVEGIIQTPPGQSAPPRVHYALANESTSSSNSCAMLWVLLSPGVNAGDIARRIDALNESSEAQTRTFPDRGLQQAILRTYHSLFSGIGIMSVFLALIGVTLLGNALALNIGEQTLEYAVFRAIGFQPAAIVRMVLLETAVVYGTAVAMGVGLSVILTKLFGVFAKKNVAWLFPSVWVRTEPLLINAAGMLLIVMLIAVASASRATKVNLVNALRGIG